MTHPLSFAELRIANVRRCDETFHPVDSWSPTDWMTAVAGEVGEAAATYYDAPSGDARDTGKD